MTEPTTENCVFCAIVAGEAPSLRIHEDDDTLAFLDINPITVGHALVVPKRHAVDLHDTPAADVAATARSAKHVAGLLTDRLGSDGVNLLHATGAAAWQTVFHFHIHVLPRVAGDLPFPFPLRGTTEQEVRAVFDRIVGDG